MLSDQVVVAAVSGVFCGVSPDGSVEAACRVRVDQGVGGGGGGVVWAVFGEECRRGEWEEGEEGGGAVTEVAGEEDLLCKV